MELPYDHAIPLPGIYSDKAFILKDICTPIHNGQDMETTQMSTTDEWIKQMWYTYTMEYYSAIKK